MYASSYETVGVTEMFKNFQDITFRVELAKPLALRFL